jgi:RNA polymerase sigma-70 factor, ECF subfamily
MLTEATSDTELLEQARSGETGSYGALVRRHHRRLYSIACRILRNEADAEDALQEAYLHIYSHLDQFEGRSPVTSWLNSIAANQAVTCARRRRPWQSLDTPAGGIRSPLEIIAAPIRDPERQAMDRQMETHIRAAIAALPAKFGQVFWLREIEGVTTQQSAMRLGISEGCVKTRLFRAKAMLRKRLDTPAAEARSPVEMIAAPVRDAEQQAMDRQMETRIKAAVAALPAKFGRVFWLMEIQGVTARQAAIRLGISEGCVKTRLFQAKTMLRKQLPVCAVA